MKKFIVITLLGLFIVGCSNKQEEIDQRYLDAISDLEQSTQFDSELEDLNFDAYYIEEDQSFRLILDNPKFVLKEFRAVAYAINNEERVSSIPQIGYFNQNIDLGVDPKGVILTGYLDKKTEFELVVRIEYLVDEKLVVKFLKVSKINLL